MAALRIGYQELVASSFVVSSGPSYSQSEYIYTRPDLISRRRVAHGIASYVLLFMQGVFPRGLAFRCVGLVVCIDDTKGRPTCSHGIGEALRGPRVQMRSSGSTHS